MSAADTVSTYIDQAISIERQATGTPNRRVSTSSVAPVKYGIRVSHNGAPPSILAQPVNAPTTLRGAHAMQRHLENQTELHMERLLGRELHRMDDGLSNLSLQGTSPVSPPQNVRVPGGPVTLSDGVLEVGQLWKRLRNASEESALARERKAKVSLDEQRRVEAEEAVRLLALLQSTAAGTSAHVRELDQRVQRLERAGLSLENGRGVSTGESAFNTVVSIVTDLCAASGGECLAAQPGTASSSYKSHESSNVTSSGFQPHSSRMQTHEPLTGRFIGSSMEGATHWGTKRKGGADSASGRKRAKDCDES